MFLGRLFALAPDEGGYLNTFNNVYTLPISTGAQTFGGWIAAPTMFLWIAYLPAKILNVLGAPDYISIRILSIFLTATSLYLVIEAQRRGQNAKKLSQKVILIFFFIPSVFLWTSLGLRESFIIVELAPFIFGLNFLFQGLKKKGILLIFLGSYGLVSTKNYLWACLMVSLILSSIFFLVRRISWQKVAWLVVSGFILPLTLFASTTLKDPQILFTLIFLAGEIAFSALVEVNLGTSFRHRSILLVPLVFLYVRLAQRAQEQKESKLGII